MYLVKISKASYLRNDDLWPTKKVPEYGIIDVKENQMFSKGAGNAEVVFRSVEDYMKYAIIHVGSGSFDVIEDRNAEYAADCA